MKVLIRVKSNSKTEEIVQEGDKLLIKVHEQPREGKANQAVIKLLAQHFGVSMSQIRILSGLRSKNKIIELTPKE